jgi:hypothetical protein
MPLLGNEIPERVSKFLHAQCREQGYQEDKDKRELDLGVLILLNCVWCTSVKGVKERVRAPGEKVIKNNGQ